MASDLDFQQMREAMRPYRTLEETYKREQTPDMVRWAIETFDGEVADRWEILRQASKKCLTYDLVSLAVSRNGRNLRLAPKKMIDYDLCLRAVTNKGSVLCDVPKQFRDYELCLVAVKNNNDSWGSEHILQFVPSCLLRGEQGEKICAAAVQHNGKVLASVPKEFITQDFIERVLTGSSPDNPYCPLDYAPENFKTKENYRLAYKVNPWFIRNAPKKCVGTTFCRRIMQEDLHNYMYLPDVYKEKYVLFNQVMKEEPAFAYCCLPKSSRRKYNKKLIEVAFAANPEVYSHIPEELRTIEQYESALAAGIEIKPWDRPLALEEQERQKALNAVLPDYTVKALNTPESLPSGAVVPARTSNVIVERDNIDGSLRKCIYYVTDIHVDYQIEGLYGKKIGEARELIRLKVEEMIQSVPMEERHSTLLIGGDVSDCKELFELFFEALTTDKTADGDWDSRPTWMGRVVSVLGNHELWEGDSEGLLTPRSVIDIVNDYRACVEGTGCLLLENELYLQHKGREDVVFNEQQLLDMDENELGRYCHDSALIVLGGIGFSGLNDRFNADMGLYSNKVAREEEKTYSARFKALHDKLLTCAKHESVIVLTHNPIHDWTHERPNPNWIYVNGHTHQNSLIKNVDGTTVLSDNQIGYRPRRWSLRGFTVNGVYDPLKDLPNGTHLITREQYIDFNRARGISMKYGRKEDIYALKYDDNYMFLSMSLGKIYLLEGGRIHTAEHDFDYYAENFPLYVERLKNAFKPYNDALRMISEEVKIFGGWGSMHGCIVDIDFFNHIYLDPFNGRIRPYYASSIEEWQEYEDVKDLLQNSPSNRVKFGGVASMLPQYLSARKNRELPLLSNEMIKTESESLVLPEYVMPKQEYKASRIMRTIQYIFDHGVLRKWNDAVLIDSHNAREIENESKQQLNGTKISL